MRFQQKKHPFRVHRWGVRPVEQTEIGAVEPGNSGLGGDPEKAGLGVPLKAFDAVGREAIVGGKTLNMVS
jgi:hypothetical protein